jgi:Spy/CpxP family protein refolding chaperone
VGDTMSNNQINENQNIYQIKMHRWRMAFFGLVILLAGIAIGVAASLLVAGRPMLGPERTADRMIQGLRHELRLSPQQRQQIEPIIHRHMERLDQIRRDARPQIENELRRMNEEIVPILDDRQRAEWVQMQRRLPMEPSPGQMRLMPRPDKPFGQSPHQPLKPLGPVPQNPEPLPQESQPLPPQ